MLTHGSYRFSVVSIIFSMVLVDNENIYRSRLRLRSAPVLGLPFVQGQHFWYESNVWSTPSASQLIVRVHFNQRLSGGNERRCPSVGGATAPPTHGQPRSFPPLSRWLKWTLTMTCEALAVDHTLDSYQKCYPCTKGSPKTGAELGSARETQCQCSPLQNNVFNDLRGRELGSNLNPPSFC